MSFLRTLFTLRSFSSTYNGCVLVIGMHSNLAQLVQRLAITLVPIFLVPLFLSTTKCCWLSKRRKRRMMSREFKSLAKRFRQLDIFKNQTSNVIFLFRIISLLSATESSSLRSYHKFATTVYRYLKKKKKKKTKQNKKKKEIERKMMPRSLPARRVCFVGIRIGGRA